MTEQTAIYFKTYSHEFALLYQDEELSESYAEVLGELKIGDIYLAKITRVLTNKQGAYLDIGNKKSAYLKHAAAVKEGDILLVAITKLPKGDKGPQVSMTFRLVGQYCIVSNEPGPCKFSRQLESLENKAAFQASVDKLSPDNQYTITIRTAAKDHHDQFTDECAALIEKIKANQLAIKASTKPRCLEQELTLGLRILRDKNPKYFISNDENFIKSEPVNHFAANTNCVYEPKLFEQYPVDEIFSEILATKKNLAAGESIIRESTEALTVFDVNSGRFMLEGIDEQAAQVNSNASKFILHDILLLNLSGILLIDFVNMKNKAQQKILRDQIIKQSKTMGLNLWVGYFNGAGILDMTRKRTRPPLDEVILENCPHCQASNHVLNPQFIFSIIELILQSAQAKQYKKKFTLHLSSRLYHYWQDIKDTLSAHWSNLTLAQIDVFKSEGLRNEQYKIDWK